MIEIAVNNKSCTDYPTECRYGTDSTDMLKLENTAHLCSGVSEVLADNHAKSNSFIKEVNKIVQ